MGRWAVWRVGGKADRKVFRPDDRWGVRLAFKTAVRQVIRLTGLQAACR